MNGIPGVDHCDPFQLIEALLHGGKVTEARLDAALAAVGLSGAKWNMLRLLAEAGEPLALGQLATLLSCGKSNITQLVDRLENEKLARRAPDPDDRRSVRAELTPEGRRRYQAGLLVVREFEQEFLNEYLPEERALLHRLLSRLGEMEAVRR